MSDELEIPLKYKISAFFKSSAAATNKGADLFILRNIRAGSKHKIISEYWFEFGGVKFWNGNYPQSWASSVKFGDACPSMAVRLMLSDYIGLSTSIGERDE